MQPTVYYSYRVPVFSPHTPCSITAPSLFALSVIFLRWWGANQTGESCKFALSFLACLCQKGVFRTPSGVAISDVTFCPGRASTLGFFSFVLLFLFFFPLSFSLMLRTRPTFGPLGSKSLPNLESDKHESRRSQGSGRAFRREDPGSLRSTH